MTDLKPHLKPYLAVEGDMVGIKVDALSEGQLIDAHTALAIGEVLFDQGNRLGTVLAAVKLEAGKLGFDSDEEKHAFIMNALRQRLGLSDA